jgi:hypothetical protein
MRCLLNTAPRGNCLERRALPERAGKYPDRMTLVSVMLFPPASTALWTRKIPRRRSQGE